MLFNYLTVFIALAISGVAIFYSVAGLATIFAASIVPIVIMGSVLEIGKLITAVWLHRNWKRAVWWLKTYLAFAVVILMFITSMGIFGFLSKSHVEQATASDDQIAKIQVIDESIIRLDTKIKRWDAEIIRLSSGSINNTRVDNLIQREQNALDKITKSIDKEKEQYRKQATTDINAINSKLSQYRMSTKSEVESINEQLKTCFSCADERQALKEAKDSLLAKETKADNDIAGIKKQLSNDLLNAVTGYSLQLNPINNRIRELKTQSTNKTQDIDKRIVTLENNIKTSQVDLTSNRANKSVLESKFRQLTAELGPVKYIAEFIYGEKADRGMLEEAVRWVIVTIIFVFDPLAVLLLIASQYSFEESRRKKKPTPPTPPKPVTLNGIYEEMIGKSFDGNWHPSDASDYNNPVNNNITYATLIGKIFEGAKHESDVTDHKIPTKSKEVKKKEKITVDKEIVKETTVIEVKPRRSKVSDKDVEVIIAMIENTDSDSYIPYENKMHRKQAFEILHPEFITDVRSTINFGVNFPEDISNATLFIRTDFLPTKLFRFNGDNWVELDKNLLKESAYSRKYILHLITKINKHDYDPILLDAVVAEGIENDSAMVFNEIELRRITEYKV